MALNYGDGTMPVTVDPVYWYGRKNDPVESLDGGDIFLAISNQLRKTLDAYGFEDIAVYDFPNYDLDTWWAGPTPAFVLVAFTGISYGPILSTSLMVQERTIEFAIFLLARQTSWAVFTGPESPYAIIEAIELSLLGFRPPGCRNIAFSDSRYTEQDPEGRIWLYKIQIRVRTMRPMQLPDYRLMNASSITTLVGNPQPPITNVYTVVEGLINLPINSMLLGVIDNVSKAVYHPGQDFLYVTPTGVLSAVPDGKLVEGTVVQITYTPVVDVITEP
jgi:Gp37 protein